MRRHARRLAFVGAALLAAGCSLLTSLDGLTGNGPALGGGDPEHPGTGSDASGDTSAPVDAPSSDAGGPDASDAAESADALDAAPFEATSCGDSGATCVPAPPTGWVGPWNLWEGATGTSGPSCDGGAAYTGNANLNAPPAQCGACTCGSPSGVSCNTVAYQNAIIGCAGPICGGSVPIGQCSGPLTSIACVAGDNVALSVPASGGSCTPSGGGVVSVPAATFARHAVACTAAQDPSGSCAPGNVCTLPGSSPLSTGACIGWVGGNVSCPAPYSVKHLYYGAMGSDTRSCTACGCDPPQGGTCSSVQVTEYTDTACGSAKGTVSAPSCAPAAGSFMATGTPSVQAAGSCPKSGGAPTGTVLGANPATICCTP